MKHLLPTFGIAALFACTPAAQAQAMHPDEVDTGIYASAVGIKPTDNIVPLYPKPINKKKLQLHPYSIYPPLGLITLERVPMAIGTRQSNTKKNLDSTLCDIITFSSTDGTLWNRADLAVPQINLPWSERRVGAVYDSTKKQVILLCLDTRYTKVAKNEVATDGNKDSSDSENDVFTPTAQRGKRKNKREVDAFGDGGDDAFEGDGVSYSYTFENKNVYVSVGKNGKFSKPKNITRQFTHPQSETDLNLKELGLCFQGICLTKGKYRGRLLFLTIISDKTMCPIYSDNHGLTWSIGKPFKIDTHSPADCASPAALGSRGDNRGLTMFEAEDGSIVSFTGYERYNGEEGQRATWVSSDDGGESWVVKTSKPGQRVTPPNPYGQAFLILNAKDGDGSGSRLLAFSDTFCGGCGYGGGTYINDESEKDRERGNKHFVAISYDWGQTWAHIKPLGVSWFDSGRNVPIQQITPGTIGMVVLWQFTTERQRFYHAPGFATFTISWLTDGKDDGVGEVKPLAGSEGAPVDKQSE